jgi:hypothetical protein
MCFEGQKDIATMRPGDTVRLTDADKSKRIHDRLNLSTPSDFKRFRPRALPDLLCDCA